MSADLACSACRHRNRSSRGYCGRCGTSLQPVCRGCRFINDATDRFCGGCGNHMVVHTQPPMYEPPPVQALPPTHSPQLAATASELTDLFTPVASSSPDDQLPSAGITQADLDRMFGGAS